MFFRAFSATTRLRRNERGVRPHYTPNQHDRQRCFFSDTAAWRRAWEGEEMALCFTPIVDQIIFAGLLSSRAQGLKQGESAGGRHSALHDRTLRYQESCWLWGAGVAAHSAPFSQGVSLDGNGGVLACFSFDGWPFHQKRSSAWYFRALRMSEHLTVGCLLMQVRPLHDRGRRKPRSRRACYLLDVELDCESVLQ